jgi:hypothetical protein
MLSHDRRERTERSALLENMMSRDAIEQAVGRALVDRAFCLELLARPESALRSYNLSDGERRLLAAIQVESLAEFAQAIERTFATPPLPRAARRRVERDVRRVRRAYA